MSDVISKKCDECGVIKKEVNGWWVLAHDKESGAIHTMPLKVKQQTGKMMDVFELHDVCGQRCASSIFAKLINMGADNVQRNSIDSPANSPAKGAEIHFSVAELSDDGDNVGNDFPEPPASKGYLREVE